MNFAVSSQRKSWIFSQESLDSCREKAVVGQLGPPSRQLRPQKFASGFHGRRNKSQVEKSTTMHKKNSILSVRDQETLVQFHAHQIQSLVGPYALLPELRRSQKVLSTAIVLFRRFFLSNSVVEFNPRKIATAAAFFAAKVEEEKIEVSQFSSRCLPIMVAREKLRRVKTVKILPIRHFCLYVKFCHHRKVIKIQSFYDSGSCMTNKKTFAHDEQKRPNPLQNFESIYLDEASLTNILLAVNRFQFWPMQRLLFIAGFAMHLSVGLNFRRYPYLRLKKANGSSWKALTTNSFATTLMT